MGLGKKAFEEDIGGDERDPILELGDVGGGMVQGKGLASWTNDTFKRYMFLVAFPPLLFSQDPSDY